MRRAPATFALAVGVALLSLQTLAAQPQAPPEPIAVDRIEGRMILGDVVPFGDGTARSWAQLDERGIPTSVGITLTEAALQGLPADVTPGLIWMVEYVLALPKDVPQLPFDHIGVNWNPRGHMPDGIYNSPHFDFHFYTVDPEYRSRITARGEDIDRCRTAPLAGFVPDAYVYADGAEEPGMGGHWVDPRSHEFHGQLFSTTFIYGAHDGKVIFYEPMITKAVLEQKEDRSIPIEQPKKVAVAGYYPTSYSIRHDARRKEITVALDGMRLRDGGEVSTSP